MSEGASPFLQLLKLAKAPARRAELLRQLADMYVASSARLNAGARAEFDAILSALIESAGPEERRAAAARLAPLADAPPALMRRLAEDAVEIAAPVLLHSRALDRPTLHRLARDGEEARRMLIARREDCSGRLGALLAERGGEETLIALAQNQRARLDGAAMDVMTARTRQYARLHEPMIARLDLPPLTLTRLYFFVAPALKKEILMRADIIEPALAAGAASANRKSVLAETGDRMDAARNFVRRSLRAGAPRETFLCDLVRSGPSPAFLVAFAYYAGVEIDAARIMLSDRRREALAVACRAGDAPRPFFAKILFGVGKGDEKAEENEAQAARMLDLYMKIPREGAERLMRFWRVRGRGAAPSAPNAQHPPQIPHLRATG